MKEKLFQKRVIIIDEPINDYIANIVVQQLIALNDSSEEDIYIFINCEGGRATSGFAIFDTIRWCKCDVNTICLSSTAAFATVLLTSGTKGKRYAFLDSLIIPTLHISSHNADGIYSDTSKNINMVIDKTIKILADNTGNELEIMRSSCLIEHILNSQEAQKLGFIDVIIDEYINKKGFRSLIKKIPFMKNDKINYLEIYNNLREKGIIS